MPRFALKGMLIGCAVVALWFSTFAGYPGSDDVRAIIVMLTVVAAGVNAFCSRGRQRCFWLAFFFVLLVTAIGQMMLVPTMYWVTYSVRPLVTSMDIYGDMQMPGPSMRKVEFIAVTIKLTLDLILATAAGCIGLYVYDHNPTANENG
jgi:hypothetical protein